MPVYDPSDDSHVFSADEVLTILLRDMDPSEVLSVLVPLIDRDVLAQALTDGFAEMLGLEESTEIHTRFNTEPESGEIVTRARVTNVGVC